MKALVQRVSAASVSVDGSLISSIDNGMLVFLGVMDGDTETQAQQLAAKTLALRIFPSDSKPMDRSVVDVAGEILVVSQLTLAADMSRGNRPSFSRAAEPIEAERLYSMYITCLRSSICTVASGEFGATMQVDLINDGPVTILLDCV